MTFRFNPYNECYPDKMVSGAMVMDKLPVPRRPTIWMIVGQGPVALPVDAVVGGGGGGGGGGVGHFYSPLSFLSSFSLSLGDGPI